MLQFKDEKGSWYTCRLGAAQAIWPQLNGLVEWLGKVVKVGIEAGEVEAIELAG